MNFDDPANFWKSCYIQSLYTFFCKSEHGIIFCLSLNAFCPYFFDSYIIWPIARPFKCIYLKTRIDLLCLPDVPKSVKMLYFQYFYFPLQKWSRMNFDLLCLQRRRSFLFLHQLHFIIIFRQSASTILFTNIQILKVEYYRKREYNLVNFLTFVTVKSIFCLSSKCSISGYWSGNHKGINVVCKNLSQEVR